MSDGKLCSAMVWKRFSPGPKLRYDAKTLRHENIRHCCDRGGSFWGWTAWHLAKLASGLCSSRRRAGAREGQLRGDRASFEWAIADESVHAVVAKLTRAMEEIFCGMQQRLCAARRALLGGAMTRS